jgi:hypothetical protein
MTLYKLLFSGLCLIVWLINTWMSRESALPAMWMGLGATLISIPFWVFLGSAFSAAAIFVVRLAKVEIRHDLSLWERGTIGLVLAVVFKPMLGIPL